MRLWAGFWTLVDATAPRAELPSAIVNWWVCSTRYNVDGRGTRWKLLYAVVDATDKVAASKLVEAAWAMQQWFELVVRSSGWMPQTAYYPSTGNEKRVLRGRVTRRSP